jgi:hypothetical protein
MPTTITIAVITKTASLVAIIGDGVGKTILN